MLHPALDKFVIITTVNVYYLFSKANYSFKDYGHAWNKSVKEGTSQLKVILFCCSMYSIMPNLAAHITSLGSFYSNSW